MDPTLVPLKSPNSPPTLPPRCRRDIYAPAYVPARLISPCPVRDGYVYPTFDAQIYVHLQCIGLMPGTFPPFTLTELYFATYLVLVFHWYQQHASISETIVDALRPQLEVSLKYHKSVQVILKDFFQNPFPDLFPYFLLELLQKGASHEPMLTSLFRRAVNQPDAEPTLQTLQACPGPWDNHFLTYVYIQLVEFALEHPEAMLEADCIAALLKKDDVQACQAIAYLHAYLRTADPAWLARAVGAALPHPQLHLLVRWHVHHAGLSDRCWVDLAQKSHPQRLVLDYADLLAPPALSEEEPFSEASLQMLMQNWTRHLEKLDQMHALGFEQVWSKCVVPFVPTLSDSFDKLGSLTFTSEWLELVQTSLEFETKLNDFRERLEPNAPKIDLDLSSKCADPTLTWLQSQRTFLLNLVDRSLSTQDDVVDPTAPSPFTESILTLFRAVHSLLKAVKQVPLLRLREHLVLIFMATLHATLDAYFKACTTAEHKGYNAAYSLVQYQKVATLAQKEVHFPWTLIGERTKCMLQEIASTQETLSLA